MADANYHQHLGVSVHILELWSFRLLLCVPPVILCVSFQKVGFKSSSRLITTFADSACSIYINLCEGLFKLWLERGLCCSSVNVYWLFCDTFQSPSYACSFLFCLLCLVGYSRCNGSMVCLGGILAVRRVSEICSGCVTAAFSICTCLGVTVCDRCSCLVFSLAALRE